MLRKKSHNLVIKIYARLERQFKGYASYFASSIRKTYQGTNDLHAYKILMDHITIRTGSPSEGFKAILPRCFPL